MRVGIISTARTFSGGAQRIWKLSSGLFKRGWEVTLYSTHKVPDTAKDFLDPGVIQSRLNQLNADEFPDVLLAGHPSVGHFLGSQNTIPVWMMLGLNESDLPMVRNPRIINLAMSSWLARSSYTIGTGRTLTAPGAVDTELFSYKRYSGDAPVGSRLRAGTHSHPERVPVFPFEHSPLTGVAPGDRPAYYLDHSVFLNHDYRSAGWCNPVAEAMASGRPVLSNRIGAVEDLIVSEDVGYIYENPEDAADRLRKWQLDPSEAAKIGFQAHEHVLQYGWDIWLDEVDKLLRKELSG